MMTTVGDAIPASIRRKIEEGRIEVPESLYEAQETDQEARERSETARRVRRAWWQRRLPVRYADAALQDLTADQNPRGAVSRWWDGDSPTLVLFSARPGIGKTHAAYAVGNWAVRHEAWAEAWSVIELLADLRPDGPEGTLERATECDLLVLDDLGRERDTDWTREQMHHIVSTRLTAGRRTVLTTNLDGATMAARYSDPFVDRLADGATIVEMRGESRRKPAAW